MQIGCRLRGRTLLTIGGTALAGLAGQQLHCPITHRAHLLAGHASVPWVLAVALGLLYIVRKGATPFPMGKNFNGDPRGRGAYRTGARGESGRGWRDWDLRKVGGARRRVY